MNVKNKILAFFKDFFNFNTNNTFYNSIKSEKPEKLKIRNASIEIKNGQTWRSAIDESDKYLEPAFLKIVDVDEHNDSIQYTSNYSGEKVYDQSISRLKTNYVLIK